MIGCRLRIYLACSALVAALIAPGPAFGQGLNEPSERDLEIRGRYEAALLASPFLEGPFDRVYESYLVYEGVETWARQLDATGGYGAHVLRARILQRQFEYGQAFAVVESLRITQGRNPDLDALAGTLLFELGRFEEAAEALGGAVARLRDPKRQSEACRLWGQALLRLDRADEAAAAWERLVQLAPGDPFAYEEAAALYESNRMWAEANGILARLIEQSTGDPYLRCRTWRRIAMNYERAGALADAIAAYGTALALAAPGNWLFEDLTDRLVEAYAQSGNLEGLLAFIDGQLAEAPADVGMHLLRGGVLARLERYDEAEAAFRSVLERAPGRIDVYECLIDLFTQSNQPGKRNEAYEALIAASPTALEVIRRYGEAVLTDGDPDRAKAIWRRVTGDGASAANHAQLAAWFERYDFTDDAIAAYRSALDGKTNAEWAVRLGSLLHRSGAEDEALAIWTAAITPDSSAEEIGDIAALLAAHNADDGAIALYTEALHRAPEHHAIRMALARLYAQQGRYEAALPHFEQLAAQTANDYLRVQGQRGAIDSYIALGTLEAKRQEWEAAMAADPGAVAPRLRLARLYQQVGERGKALDLYRACADLEPDNPSHVRETAALLGTLRRTDEAVALYETLIAADPARARVYSEDILRLYTLGNRKLEAVQAAERLVQFAYNDPEARLALGRAYLAAGNPRDAVDQYRRAAALAPEDAAVHRQLAETLEAVERHDEARSAYEHLLELATDMGTRLHALGRLAALYARAGHGAELAATYEARLRGRPRDLAVYRELAAVQAALGDVDASLATLKAAQERAADGAGAAHALLAAAHDAGRMDVVVEAHKRILALSGAPMAEDYDRLGRAYAAMGDLERAAETWARMVRTHPGDPAVYKRAAQSYAAWGMADEALEAQRQAIALDPGDLEYRIEYAQSAAAAGNPDAAVDELLHILDALQWDDDAAGPTGQQPSTPPLRPHVIVQLAHAAQAAGLVDRVVAHIEDRAAALQGVRAIRDDLLSLYSHLALREKAVELAGHMADDFPDDPGLRYQYAQRLWELGRHEDAAAQCDMLLGGDGPATVAAALLLIRIEADGGRLDDAVARAERMFERHRDDGNVVRQLMVTLVEAGQSDTAMAMLDRLLELEPANAVGHRIQLARMFQQRGEREGMRRLYEALLFETPPMNLPQPAASGASRSLYTPILNLAHYGTANGVRRLPQIAPFPVNAHRLDALQNLVQMNFDEAIMDAVAARLGEAAEAWFTAETAEARDMAREAQRVYLCYLDVSGEHADALGLIDRTIAAGESPDDWSAPRLYFLQRLERYDAMAAEYDRIERESDRPLPEMAVIRVNLALLRDDYETVAAGVRELAGDPNRVNIVQSAIYGLANAGQDALAIALLDELAAHEPVPREVQNMRIAFYSQAQRHDDALAVARQLWDETVAKLPDTAWSQSPRTPNQTSAREAFSTLLNAYSAAGQLPELTANLEAQVAKHPQSVFWRECLLRLHQSTGDAEKTLAVQLELAEMLPNSVDMQVRLTELYANANQPGEAAAIFRTLLQRDPDLYLRLTSQIRNVYKRAGLQDELRAFEERFARSTTDIRQLERLAMEWITGDEPALAAEALERILRMGPSRIRQRLQLASVYRQTGRRAEAIAAYEQYLMDPRVGQMDNPPVNECQVLISLYAEENREPELIEKSAQWLAAEPRNRAARALHAALAIEAKRYDDALAVIEALHAEKPNAALLQHVVDLAEAKGDYALAIDTLENRLATQGARDTNRLATLYLKTGDTAKAVELWHGFALEQGSVWAFAQVLDTLAEHKAYDGLKEIYQSTADRFANDLNAVNNLEGRLMRIAAQDPVLRPYFEERVATKPGPRRTELLSGYKVQGDIPPAHMCTLVEALLPAYPDDTGLLRYYASVLDEAGRTAESAAVYQRLTERDADDESVARRYAEVLSQEQSPAAALEWMAQWVEAKPTLARISTLVNMAQRLDRDASMLALRDRLVPLASDRERPEAAAAFAKAAAEAGDPEWARTALLSAYEFNASLASFGRLIAYLYEWGYIDDLVSALDQRPMHNADKDNRPALHLLVQAYAVTGDTDAFLSLLRGLNPIHESDVFAMRPVREFPMAHAHLAAAGIETDVAATADTRIALAQAYAALGDYPKALAVLKFIPGDGMTDERVAHLRGSYAKRMGGADAHLAVLEATWKADPDRDPRRSMAWIELGNAYLAAGQPERIRALLDTMSFPEGIVHVQLPRAILLAQLGDKTAAEAALAAAGPDVRMPQNRVRAAAVHVWLGDLAEARAIASRFDRVSEHEIFYGTLMEAGAYDLAAEWGYTELLGKANHGWFPRDFAKACLLAECPPLPWHQVLRDAYTNETDSSRGNWPQVCRDFLRDNGLVDQVMDNPDLIRHPLFGQALADILTQDIREGAEPDQAQIDGLLAAMTFDNPAVHRAAGELLYTADRGGEAVAHWRALIAHPDASPRNLVTAAWCLQKYGPRDAADAALLVLEKDPDMAIGHPALLDIAGASGAPDLVDALLEAVRGLPADVAGAATAEARLLHAAGQSHEAMAVIERAIACTPLKVTRDSVQHALDLAASHDDPATTLPIFERVAAGGFGPNARDRALRETARVQAGLGAIDAAVAAMADMSPRSRMFSHRAWQAVCQAGRPNAVAHAVQAAIAAAPGNDRVSDLIVLAADAHRAQGLPADPITWAQDWGASAREQEETAYLDAVIRDWVHFTPIRVPQGRDPLEPAPHDSISQVLAPGAVPDSNEPAWTRHRLGDGPGVMWTYAPDTTPAHYGPGTVYAVTDITSPGGPAELSISTSDAMRLWMNGAELVWTRTVQSNTIHYDQERIAIRLQPGVNRLVVALANHGPIEGFAIALLDAPEGTTVNAPDWPGG